LNPFDRTKLSQETRIDQLFLKDRECWQTVAEQLNSKLVSSPPISPNDLPAAWKQLWKSSLPPNLANWAQKLGQTWASELLRKDQDLSQFFSPGLGCPWLMPSLNADRLRLSQSEWIFGYPDFPVPVLEELVAPWMRGALQSLSEKDITVIVKSGKVPTVHVHL